jgi:hypothetical protein
LNSPNEKKYRILLFATIQSIFFACTETNNVINPGDKPVIEAYLAPNHPVSLKAHTEIPYSESSEGVSKAIDGLSIKIIGNNGKTFLLKSIGNGLYVSKATEIVGAAGTSYLLEFDYKGRKVTASTEIPAKPISFASDKKEISRTQVDLSAGFQRGIRPPLVEVLMNRIHQLISLGAIQINIIIL